MNIVATSPESRLFARVHDVTFICNRVYTLPSSVSHSLQRHKRSHSRRHQHRPWSHITHSSRAILRRLRTPAPRRTVTRRGGLLLPRRRGRRGAQLRPVGDGDRERGEGAVLVAVDVRGRLEARCGRARAAAVGAEVGYVAGVGGLVGGGEGGCDGAVLAVGGGGVEDAVVGLGWGR